MGELIVVKHAAPEIVEGLPSARWVLSESGREQCEELHSRLVQYKPAHLYTSEEPKAVQTAEILGPRLGVPVSPRPRLNENDRTGLPFFDDESEFNARLRAFFLRPSERVLGNESADEAHARFIGAVQDVLASAQGQPTLIVAHGTVTSLLVARANQLNPFSFWLELDFTSFVVLSTPSFKLAHVVHPDVAEPGDEAL